MTHPQASRTYLHILLACAFVAAALLTSCYAQTTNRPDPHQTLNTPCDDRLKQAINRTPGPYGPDDLNYLITQLQADNPDCTAFTWDPIPDEAAHDASCGNTPLRQPGAVGALPIPPDLAWTDHDPISPTAAAGFPPTHWLTPDSTVTRAGNVIIHWSPIASPYNQANCWLYDARLKRWSHE